MVLTEKEAAHWVFRGEGAANLVLAYTGSFPAFVRSLLLLLPPIQLLSLLIVGVFADWESDANS